MWSKNPAELSLMEEGRCVLCAVSGGADSVALLDALRESGKYRLLCAHYNHCLRGEESERDERFVRELCERWDIPCFVGRGDVRGKAETEGLSLETAAREARYAFLERTAAENGADYIATAHNADDNAETLLFRMARGTGLRGLGGIPPRRGKLVRPLLGATRSEIEQYLAERGLSHVEDSSNASDEAARNRLRHAAMPALRSVNGACAKHILALSESLREDEEFLRAEAGARFSALWDGNGLDAEKTAALPRSMSYRVLCMAADAELSRDEFEALLRLCRSEDPGAELTLRFGRAQRRYERLCFPEEGETVLRLPERELSVGETLLMPECGLRASAELLLPGSEIQSSFNTFFFSYGKICGKLTFTARSEGDSVKLLRREGRRTLHRLMIDAKIPRRERDLVPVLRDEEGILAVYGFGQAERALPEDGERVLRVTVEKI